MDELLEQHPELRPRIIQTRAVHRDNQSRRINAIGGYEWWRVEAFDHDRRDGVSVSFFRGDPFDVRYRQLVRAYRAGHLPDPSEARPMMFPAVHIHIVRNGRLEAMSVVTHSANSFQERASDDGSWSIDIGANQIAAYGDGWSIVAGGPASRLGPGGLWRPGVDHEASIELQLSVKPSFHTHTLQRASMPDSPSGATHDWLIACPSAVVSGRIVVNRPRDSFECELTDASGAFDHLWGGGPIGEGFRRWYRSRCAWKEGVAFAEMTILRKFMQLAGTLMLFQPDRPPELVRCERPPATVYQRGQWLMAYPLEVVWRDLSGDYEMAQSIDRPARMAPHRAFFFSRVRLDCGEPPDELVVDDGQGVFEVIQPRRLDLPAWRPWMQSRR